MRTTDDLRIGRENMKRHCIEVALKYTPPSLLYIIPRRNLSGRAAWSGMWMAAPRPFTRKALYIFLHECAHITLAHNGKRKPRHVEEMEAEQYAHKIMRDEGLSVPRAMTQRAKRYVARKIRQAEARGCKNVSRAARAFAA